MIKKAIEYIVDLAKPNTQTVNGHFYSDKSLYRISYNPKADPIEMNTLSSLVDYIKANIDEMEFAKMIIHVQSPTRIELYSALDEDRNRECLVRVNAQLPSFSFDRYTEHEAFCINLQSKFVDDLDRALLLKFAGTVESGTVASYGDDGVSQKATVKTGIASKGEAIVPSPVKLKAYRTFVEVEQPTSEFIFRMKQDSRAGIECALFEADGGAWKIEAMKAIKAYLERELAEMNFTVIS